MRRRVRTESARRAHRARTLRRRQRAVGPAQGSSFARATRRALVAFAFARSGRGAQTDDVARTRAQRALAELDVSAVVAALADARDEAEARDRVRPAFGLCRELRRELGFAFVAPRPHRFA